MAARLHLPAWAGSNIRWLLAGRLVRSFAQAFLIVAVPLYFAAAGYSTIDVGYLLSIASVGSGVFILLIGFYADRVGRRRLMLALAASSAVGAAVYGLTSNFWALAVAGAVASLGRGSNAGGGGIAGPFYPTEQPLVAQSCAPEDRNAAFGAMSFAGAMGAAAGSAAAVLPDVAHAEWHLPWLASYRLLFWLAVALGVALFVCVLPVREPPREAEAAAPPSRATLRLLGKLWITNGMNGISMGLMGPFLSYWLFRRYGVGPAALGTLFTLVNLLVALPYLVGPLLARRFGAVRTVVVTRGASVGFFLLMVFSPTFLAASIFFLLRMMTGSLGVPLRQSFFMGVSEERSRSTVAAFGNLPSQVTAAVSPSIGAYAMEAVGIEAPMLLAATVQLFNAIAFHLAFRGTRPPEEAA